jgi:glycosyltransferase involved in cell wall biosynthesis
LAEQLEGVRALHLDAKGRGRALRAAWSNSDADIVAYMDVDLSTDLCGLLPLIAATQRRGPMSLEGALLGAAMTLCIFVVVTTWCLAAAKSVHRGAVIAELLALTGGTLAAAFVRFMMLRAIVFRAHVGRDPQQM